MNKNIDINNEEEILKECNFDYFYDSEVCSRELCMFNNDIYNANSCFDKRQAHIDLGRIAITLNNQFKQISVLQSQVNKLKKILESAFTEDLKSIGIYPKDSDCIKELFKLL